MADNRTTMSNKILECILPYIQDPPDRAAISLVCKQWYELDCSTRRHVTIALCYTTTPQRLHNRFPNIESLKLKGKPRAAMFNLIPEDWGGYVRPWVDILGSCFPCLNSLHFRRMIVRDSDLETIATVKGHVLQSLKLDKCSGFSTDGLVHIARSCKNLRILFLEGSTITETNGEWFHQLAVNNTTLETLSFYLTILEKISVEDLELLAKNCPLTSVKIGNTDVVHLGDFFRTSTTLQEFYGSITGELDQYSTIVFPAQLSSAGLRNLLETQIPVLFPVAYQLKKLNLVVSSLNIEGHCNLIRRCPNLEDLETANVIGDQGLEVVSSTCKRLKRLRIERGADGTQGILEESSVVTQRGLIALAEGCPQLEYLAVYVSDITNEALKRIGSNLKNLNDFRLGLLHKDDTITDLPLDNGVRALLQGCQNIRRFALYLRPGALTDVGLGYVGQFSKEVRWMFLGYVGETDAGLLEFSRGCPSLQKLEMRACCFTERALAIAATQLSSLRYMWVQGYRASQMGTIDIRQIARPFWNIELIPGNQYDDNDGQNIGVGSSQILAYYSLVGHRTDHPETVALLEM